jgi:hypothetical protein
MFNLCAPAIIYLLFSITQILIDLYNGMYNTAFMKVIVASMVTLLLNILEKKDYVKILNDNFYIKSNVNLFLN